ncbi:ABC transporter ATP-binding protein [Fusibacter paucivorans]|uniref:ABC transporter ATP-binding protein n=1 Tax=Fusibacter paucivorans TaxID=76009 RepID=A0ABS5PQZ4_9FIRM|nr:ABC transporter ATP-binding protein [Fusibacter paucivorans]MBS7526472.1 ABC transporter ATP-binding protein [Fusibacter paucivorans]
MAEALLALKAYRVSLKISDKYLEVIRGIDLKLAKGEVLGIIGESGSGKSVLLKTMLGLMDYDSYRVDSGTLLYEGESMLELPIKKRYQILGRSIAYIFQNPKQSLSQRKTIQYHFKEQFKVLGKPYDASYVKQLLSDVGIENQTTLLKQYPYQLSGGQGQRIALALALVAQPKVIIADEPTSAIDATLKLKMMKLLKQINEKYGTAMIIVTHDFDVIHHITQRVVVMYGGLVMNEGDTQALMKASVHPYTRGLITCAESLKDMSSTLYELSGYPLNPLNFKEACPFAERCERKTISCEAMVPIMETYRGERYRCCHPYLDANDGGLAHA